MVYQRIPHEDLAKSALAKLTDVASAALGSTIIEVTDEFFAAATNMINPAPPIHAPGKFVSTGAWMDGWETKRHNPTYDWAIIKLGFAGSIRGFDVDTSYFTGNQAPAASVEAAFAPDGNLKDAKWVEILPKVDLPPSCHNVFVLDKETEVYTHLRVNNIPDGGIARFRAYGTVHAIFPEDKSTVLDLAFVGNGGHTVFCTNEHYTPSSNLLLPGRGQNMGDGWETKRSRIPGYSDHTVIKLGAKGHLLKAVLDTTHYKGNYPNKITLEATSTEQEVPEESAAWTSLIEPSSVGAHGLYYFDLPSTDKAFTHARFTIYPDGGAKRLRLYGIREGGKLPQLPIANPQFEKFDDEVNGNAN
ncbi:allantoicase [Zychaea mexicana]|uniref:allantoicase n=1 Tax=Zychaea mexicana TaxID=64656 RepID=UPI0022FE4CC2|nr:allantoicase [Zychaea mexicana]KAI9497961.1 allantoicase [Zychaea mexicana]